MIFSTKWLGGQTVILVRFELVLGKWKSLHPHEYTWSTIINALEDPSVDAMDVAAELRTRYFC